MGPAIDSVNGCCFAPHCTNPPLAVYRAQISVEQTELRTLRAKTCDAGPKGPALSFGALK